MPISLKFGDGNPGSIPLLQFAHKTNQNTVGLTDCWRYAQSKGTTRLMSTRTFRGAAAAALSIGLATTGLTSAQAATDPTPGTLTRAPSSTLATLQADALRVLGQSPNKSSLAATPPGIIQMTSVCPTGQSPDALHSYESFEAGLPFPDLSDGFTVATGTGAPDGSHWASSTLPADPAVPPAIHVVDSNYALVPQTGKVYLSFSYRGTFANGFAAARINSDFWEPAPNPDWTAVALDITSEATTAGDGTVDVSFGHLADAATAGSFDVDDVALYTCKANANPPPAATPPPAPNSGVRGDWTGQGTVDLMSTRSDGTLWAYEGNGNGTVRSGVKVGSGWSIFTWQGSPGDVNGDGRTDLLARRSDGTLHLYRILPTGGLRYVRQIGNGWNGMSSIIGMGDLNSDKRGDLVAVRTDGKLFSYLSSGTGLKGAKQVGSGWNGMTLLTSPGDMNKDGRGDLIARSSNGTLWFYAGAAGVEPEGSVGAAGEQVCAPVAVDVAGGTLPGEGRPAGSDLDAGPDRAVAVALVGPQSAI